ncbi:hypothetical protein [Paenibacillus xerothermodurans]|nr:hypothetical protein [Paenibacillus xerothermodurans]
MRLEKKYLMKRLQTSDKRTPAVDTYDMSLGHKGIFAPEQLALVVWA